LGAVLDDDLEVVLAAAHGCCTFADAFEELSAVVNELAGANDWPQDTPQRQTG
jgi:hypothetical protein